MKVDRAVLPHAAGLRLRARGVVSGDRPGEHRSRLAGRGVELADHRAYGAGDELRLIDWNAWQRLGTLQVRLFHESRGQRIHVVLDTSASMGEPAEKADHAATLAASLSMMGLLQRDAVHLSLGGGADPRAASGSDGAAFGAVLRAIETAQVGGADLDGLLRVLASGRSDRVILLTDLLLPPDQTERLLRATRAAGREAVVLHVLSDAELRPSFTGPQELEDAETGELLLVDGGPEVAARYQQALDRWLTALPGLASRLGVRYLPAWVRTPIDEVFTELRRARVVESARGSG